MQITSKNNSLVKELRLLKTTKGRRESGLFLVEGPHLVAELFSCGHEVLKLLVGIQHNSAEIGALVETACREKIPVYELSEQVMRDLSDTEQPQGILSVVRQSLNPNLPDTPVGENYLALVIDRVQDPGNLGVLVRTAWAFGARLCVMTPGTVDLYNPKAIRATMGGLFHLATAIASPEEIMTWAQKNGVILFAGDPRAAAPLYRKLFPEKTGLIVGNEGNGLSAAWEGGDMVEYVSIPLPGQAESLNVSTAAAIMFYEVVRQGIQG